MKSVSMADLRANLSHYIRKAQQGSEFEVLHRGTPVARISPPIASDDKDLDELEPGYCGFDGNRGRADRA